MLSQWLRASLICCLVGLGTQSSAQAGVFLNGLNSLHFQAIDQLCTLAANGRYYTAAGNKPAAVGDRVVGLMLATSRSGQTLTHEVHGAFDLTVGYAEFGPASSSQPNALNVVRQELVVFLPTDTRATHGQAKGGILNALPAGTAMAVYEGGTSLSTALNNGDSLSSDIAAATSGTLLGAYGMRANEYALGSQGGAGNGYWFGVLTEFGKNDANGVFHERSLDPGTTFYYGLRSIRSAGGEFAQHRFAPWVNGSLPVESPTSTQIGHNAGTGRPGSGQMGFDLVGNWSFAGAVTPEPGTLALWGMGTAMLYLVRRRRAGAVS